MGTGPYSWHIILLFCFIDSILGHMSGLGVLFIYITEQMTQLVFFKVWLKFGLWIIGCFFSNIERAFFISIYFSCTLMNQGVVKILKFLIKPPQPFWFNRPWNMRKFSVLVPRILIDMRGQVSYQPYVSGCILHHRWRVYRSTCFSDYAT